MGKKYNILCHSDSAIAGTGFGVVSKYILNALHETGDYNIHHLAINFHGDFVDKSIIPWQQQPAKLLDPKDPHGIKMFAKTLLKNQYDLIWICNDLYVTHQMSDYLRQIKEKYIEQKIPLPIIFYYYPVDCHVTNEFSSFLNIADIPVCYNEYGKKETLQTLPSLKKKLVEIPHGVNNKVFKPLTKNEIIDFRRQYLGVDEKTTVVINVNRNSTRKQIQYSIAAFKEFKKQVPNSIMYIHTSIKDQGGDLIRAVDDLRMNTVDDIIFPVKYSPSNPISEESLNCLYNTADIFLTTTLGEGWGISVTEAMATGVPVVAPNNTAIPQQLGENSERGYMYPCKDILWADQSGFRPKGLIPDIVEKMVEAYNDGPKQENKKVKLAKEWALQHDWSIVTKKWIELFKQELEKPKKQQRKKTPFYMEIE